MLQTAVLFFTDCDLTLWRASNVDVLSNKTQRKPPSCTPKPRPDDAVNSLSPFTCNLAHYYNKECFVSRRVSRTNNVVLLFYTATAVASTVTLFNRKLPNYEAFNPAHFIMKPEPMFISRTRILGAKNVGNRHLKLRIWP